MAKHAQLSREKRESIMSLRKEGLSLKKIAKALEVSTSAVAKTIKRVEETGTHEDRVRSGRPKVTSESENNFIQLACEQNEDLTASEIQAQLNANRTTDVSVSTVQRRLWEAGLAKGQKRRKASSDQNTSTRARKLRSGSVKS